MRAVLIAVVVIAVFIAGKYIIAAADQAKFKVEAIHDAMEGVSDCRKDVYEKKDYDAIRSHLYPPENKYMPTSVQMVESTTPTPDERTLLAKYHDDVNACKNAATKKIQTIAPELLPIMKENLAKADDIMDRLVAGSMTWGEAAHLSDNLRHSGK